MAHNFLISNRERQEFRVFMDLLLVIPGLEEKLMEADQDEIIRISEHVLLTCSLLQCLAC